MRRLRLIDAPSNLGLRPPAPGMEPGVAGMARALRRHGLRERLGAVEGGVVPAPAYAPDPEPETGVRNAAAIAAYSRRLADRIGAALDAGERPVVVGGDCGILLGAALALRRRGRFGLAFVDGHTDFRHPGGPDPVGAAAGEDLALVTGRGHPRLTAIDGPGLSPYVRDEDVAAIGHDRAAAGYAGFDRTAVARFDAETVRSRGADAVVAAALGRLAGARRSGFWVHFDCDVLDHRVMPAVDSPNPSGLRLEEAGALLAGLAAAPGVVGFDLTIFDPTLDATGELTARLVELFAAALNPATGAGA